MMSSSPSKETLKAELAALREEKAVWQLQTDAFKRELASTKKLASKEHAARKQAEQDRDLERSERKKWRAFSESRGLIQGEGVSDLSRSRGSVAAPTTRNTLSSSARAISAEETKIGDISIRSAQLNAGDVSQSTASEDSQPPRDLIYVPVRVKEDNTMANTPKILVEESLEYSPGFLKKSPASIVRENCKKRPKRDSAIGGNVSRQPQSITKNQPMPPKARLEVSLDRDFDNSSDEGESMALDSPDFRKMPILPIELTSKKGRTSPAMSPRTKAPNFQQQTIAGPSHYEQRPMYSKFGPPPTPPIDYRRLEEEAVEKQNRAGNSSKRKVEDDQVFQPIKRPKVKATDDDADVKPDQAALQLAIEAQPEWEELPGQNFLRDIRRRRNAEIAENPEKYKRGRNNDGDDTVNSRFAIDPSKNRGEARPYYDVARKKSERKQMHGRDCECCRGYYEKAAGLERRINAVGVTGLNDRDQQKLDSRRDKVSRHRDYWAEPASPPEYWQMGFPDTQRVEAINVRARAMRGEKVKQIEREIRRGDGRYIEKK